eukprot:3077008-Pyramimonas_sp.AAC.1
MERRRPLKLPGARRRRRVGRHLGRFGAIVRRSRALFGLGISALTCRKKTNFFRARPGKEWKGPCSDPGPPCDP